MSESKEDIGYGGPDDNDGDSDTSTATSSSSSNSSSEEEFIPTSEIRLAPNRRVKLHPYVVTMINFAKEITLLLFAIFTTYAALTNDPPKIVKSPPAYPFFPSNSVVKDWYRGQIGKAYEDATRSQLSFVMFYAPWDARSQSARAEFEITARFMQKLVSFNAVNCWQPGSECRNQYSKVYNWPVLIAYPVHARGILYNGPRDASHMIRFLSGLMKPLTRITNLGEVKFLLAQYDAVVVGEVTASPGSRDYSVFYNTALRFIEKDPVQNIAFSVKTVPMSADYRPRLRIYMWNDTVEYPSYHKWKSSTLLSWTLDNLRELTTWVTPTGSKSSELALFLQPGPALILFTPRNPLATSVDYYNLLHEVGLELYNCNGSIKVSPAMVHYKRLENYYKNKLQLKHCATKQRKDAPKNQQKVVTYSPNCWTNNSCSIETSPCPICTKQDKCTNNKDCEIAFTEIKEVGEKEDCHGSDLEGLQNKYETSMIVDNIRSPKNLLKIQKQNECLMAKLASRLDPIIVSPDLTQASLPNVTSLACKENSTLSLVAMDSIRYYNFAERLGIDIRNRVDKTAAVIVDEKMESHYLLQRQVTDSSLRKFVENFLNSNLTRAFYSSSGKYKNTHEYKERSQYDFKHEKVFDVPELNYETFLPTVMELNKAVIVFYHSKQCAFCSGISHTFLTTARALSLVDSIKFARIDGELNSLPWEYTMEKFPTILFFPPKRKSESRAFPQGIPMTVPNLIGFILTNLEPSLKLHAMWSLCNKTKFSDDKEQCIKSLRSEILTTIGKTLRAWRLANARLKAEAIYKLQQLKNLHLLLEHSPNDIKTIQEYMRKLQLKRANDKLKCSEKCLDLDLIESNFEYSDMKRSELNLKLGASLNREQSLSREQSFNHELNLKNELNLKEELSLKPESNLEQEVNLKHEAHLKNSESSLNNDPHKYSESNLNREPNLKHSEPKIKLSENNPNSESISLENKSEGANSVENPKADFTGKSALNDKNRQKDSDINDINSKVRSSENSKDEL